MKCISYNSNERGIFCSYCGPISMPEHIFALPWRTHIVSRRLSNRSHETSTAFLTLPAYTFCRSTMYNVHVRSLTHNRTHPIIVVSKLLRAPRAAYYLGYKNVNRSSDCIIIMILGSHICCKNMPGPSPMILIVVKKMMGHDKRRERENDMRPYTNTLVLLFFPTMRGCRLHLTAIL